MTTKDIQFQGKDFLDYVLHDGYGYAGGVGSTHYTLDDYLGNIAGSEIEVESGFFEELSYEELLELDMLVLNNALVESGIMPIPTDFEDERAQLACYAAALCREMSGNSEEDMFGYIQKCIDWSEHSVFDVLKTDGRYRLDMESGKNMARSFAKNLTVRERRKNGEGELFDKLVLCSHRLDGTKASIYEFIKFFIYNNGTPLAFDKEKGIFVQLSWCGDSDTAVSFSYTSEPYSCEFDESSDGYIVRHGLLTQNGAISSPDSSEMDTEQIENFTRDIYCAIYITCSD